VKIYHVKMQAKIGMNGNYLLSRPKPTKSCNEEQEVLDKYSKLI
jgi:hypothetical protein